MTSSATMGLARRRCMQLLTALVAGTALAAAANPMKTDKGNPIRNLQYFPDGVIVNNIQILPPGWVTEDGTGPPGKAEGFTPVGKEWTDAEKKKINDDNKTAFPGITVVGDPSKGYDCHGFTFKSKKMRIDNAAVDTILVDQGWVKVDDKKHKKGDVVIYRDAAGRVTHSGVVEEVGADGNVSKVRSKWGAGGEYVHAPKDVPASYGPTLEVRSGGKPLADPPILPEDTNVFRGIQPPPLKAELFDPTVAPVTEGYISANATPNPTLEGLGHSAIDWQYGLTIPQLGLTITLGDTLRLYGNLWVAASVGSFAASSAFGAWQVQDVLPDSIVFAATASAFVPGSFDGLIDGFAGVSRSAPAGAMVYTEAIAGSVALSIGPVPEPASYVLMLLGVGIVLLASRRKGRSAA